MLLFTLYDTVRVCAVAKGSITTTVTSVHLYEATTVHESLDRTLEEDVG